MTRAVAAALALVTAATLLLRTGILDSGYWIDEAITVGIASHDLADIPRMLRLDGSPPLFYLLLHGWMALVGSGEAATRALPLLFALLAVPVSWWAGTARLRPPRGRPRRGGRGRLPVPDLLRAGDADVLAGRGAVRARVRVLRARVPARSPALPVAAGRLRSCCCSTRTTGRCSSSPGWASRGCGCGAAAASARRDGALLAAGVALLYAPWVPSLALPGRQHGGAVGPAPDALSLLGIPGSLFGYVGVGRCSRSRSSARAAAPPSRPRRCRCWR